MARCPQCKRFKAVDKPCKRCGIMPSEKQKEPLTPAWMLWTLAGWTVFGALVVWRLLQNAN